MSRQERPESICRVGYWAKAIVLSKCCYGGESVAGGCRVTEIKTGIHIMIGAPPAVAEAP